MLLHIMHYPICYIVLSIIMYYYNIPFIAVYEYMVIYYCMSRLCSFMFLDVIICYFMLVYVIVSYVIVYGSMVFNITILWCTIQYHHVLLHAVLYDCILLYLIMIMLSCIIPYHVFDIIYIYVCVSVTVIDCHIVSMLIDCVLLKIKHRNTKYTYCRQSYTYICT